MRRSWLTVGEAAEFLGVSEPALRKWTDAGCIPSFRTMGGHRRYHLEGLEDFRRQSEERATDAEVLSVAR